jgi:hypothetical protein
MQSSDLTQRADDVYEAIRAMNRDTITTGPGNSVPAPVMYQLLGSLNNAGYGMAQLLQQLDTALAASLTEYHVYDHNRGPVGIGRPRRPGHARRGLPRPRARQPTRRRPDRDQPARPRRTQHRPEHD